MKKSPRARAFDPFRDDPIVQQLLAQRLMAEEGRVPLPQGPGVGLPYGAPERHDWEPQLSDAVRATSPDWYKKAARFAETYPGLTLADPALAALADAVTADRERVDRDGVALAREILHAIPELRAWFRARWATPVGQRAHALAERHAAAPNDPVFTRSWNRRIGGELAYAEAHIVGYLQALCRYVTQPAIPVDAVDPRREALKRPVIPVAVPDRRCGSRGRVAADVADYLAAHHPKGKCVWADVALVLEFYDWDLGQTALRYKAQALKQAAQRARRPPKTLARAVPKRSA